MNDLIAPIIVIIVALLILISTGVGLSVLFLIVQGA